MLIMEFDKDKRMISIMRLIVLIKRFINDVRIILITKFMLLIMKR